MVGHNEQPAAIIKVSNEAMLDVSAATFENDTSPVTITNVAPPGVGTATISKWLAVKVNDVNYYIPMWT